MKAFPITSSNSHSWRQPIPRTLCWVGNMLLLLLTSSYSPAWLLPARAASFGPRGSARRHVCAVQRRQPSVRSSRTYPISLAYPLDNILLRGDDPSLPSWSLCGSGRSVGRTEDNVVPGSEPLEPNDDDFWLFSHLAPSSPQSISQPWSWIKQSTYRPGKAGTVHIPELFPSEGVDGGRETKRALRLARAGHDTMPACCTDGKLMDEGVRMGG